MDEVDADRFEMVPIDEWDSLRTALQEFCRGRVEADDGVLECNTGGARFAVHRDGRVEAGMPLHEFGRGGVESIGFDHDQGELLVVGSDLRYVFRHP